MSQETKNKLWEEYSKQRTSQTRDKLIIEYAPLVKVVAGRLSMYLGSNVEYEDLCGYGIFGLIDAIDKFDISKGVKFETYASLRIRGAIIDQIRKMDWIPRTLRQKQKKMDAAYQKFANEEGRTASDDEIAVELDISVDELNTLQSQMQVSNLISLDEYMETGESGIENEMTGDYVKPEKIVEQEELKRIIADELKKLTEKEQKVVYLYYYEGLTLREISEILDVSESRVSQLHSKAIAKLRSKLGPNMELFLE
jgi:RNA polymerase sigma factor FliA